MDINLVVDHFGGLQATASALGSSKQVVHHWKKTKNIPFIWQCHIEHATEGKFSADTTEFPFQMEIT